MELSSLMGQNKENEEVKEDKKGRREEGKGGRREEGKKGRREEGKKGRRETEKIVRNLILKIEEGWGRLQMFQTIFTPHCMTMSVI